MAGQNLLQQLVDYSVFHETAAGVKPKVGMASDPKDENKLVWANNPLVPELRVGVMKLEMPVLEQTEDEARLELPLGHNAWESDDGPHLRLPARHG